MRVFLSWSGEISKSIANALTAWLPDIILAAEPWMSEHNIQAGILWDQELSNQLNATDCAVLLLTKENRSAPWLLLKPAY